LAFQAKKLLEPQGWQAKGRAWIDSHVEGEPTEFFATLTATRGEEMISFLWRNGKLVSQEYSMWSTDKPTQSGMPRKRLDFEPDELTDSALVKRLSGRKITFWNHLGKTTQIATLPRGVDKRIKVEHLMNGNGDEEHRVISFVDQAGTGFRAFYVDALLKVV
jgi:hypothetical protein